MHVRPFALVFLAALTLAAATGRGRAGAEPPGSEEPQGQPLPAAREAIAQTIVPAVVAARGHIQSAILPAAPAPGRDGGMHPAAVDLIVEFEVSSQAYYDRRLSRPIWPGGASGATIGVGYDLGHQTARVILEDWHAHAQRERLPEASGIVGEPARAAAQRLGDVVTAYGLAYAVFRDASLPAYASRTRRVFGGSGYDRLPAAAQGALVSLVYNRGTSMRGDARREMRAIRDTCVPAADVECIARELRSMCRLWVGTELEAGLCRRRHAEAELAEQRRT